jgi:hypothetical protein
VMGGQWREVQKGSYREACDGWTVERSAKG